MGTCSPVPNFVQIIRKDSDLGGVVLGRLRPFGWPQIKPSPCGVLARLSEPPSQGSLEVEALCELVLNLVRILQVICTFLTEQQQ